MSTTAPATTTAVVRFPALRGRVPLAWGAVAALAVVLAFANGFVIVTMEGATGAIERAQGPFGDWLRYSAVLVPVFGLAVTWALSRAYRRGHGIVRTLLLLFAAATAVAVVALIANTAYDYHLQTALLAKTAGLHVHGTGPGDAGNSAYADSFWTPEQRDTMLLSVRAIGFGSVVMVAVNLFFVGWVTALLGGRLRRAASRPESVPASS